MREEEDIAFEPAEEEEDGARVEEKLAKVRKELEAARKEKQENLDGWQRAKADYVNALRRFEDEKKQERKKGAIDALRELIPVLDALERAKAHGDVPEDFQGIVKQIEKAFEKLGVSSVGEVGEAFDPAMHEAYGEDIITDKKKDNTITSVLEAGYRVGETLVRPAKVRIAHLEA